MNRITIREQDLTTYSTAVDMEEVIYVPGFAGDGATVASRTPKLCTSLEQFNEYFGVNPAQFLTDQNYPTQSSSTLGFAEDDIPAVKMFNQGEPDPSYIYAKELLTAGFQIIYESFNVTDQAISVTDLYDGLIGKSQYITTAPEYAAGQTYEKDTIVKVTTAVGTSYETIIYKALEKITNSPAEIDVDKWVEIDTTEDAFSPSSYLVDTQEYSFKYLTTGGYPNWNYGGGVLSQMMLTLCATRGDSIAFIDHTNNQDRKVTGPKSVYASINSWNPGFGEYGTMITPWGHYGLLNNYPNVTTAVNASTQYGYALPGSFAYFKALGNALRGNESWLAVAGVTRGFVPNLNSLCVPKGILSNSIADSFQSDLTNPNLVNPSISINAITNIKSYGYCIMGNRTAQVVTAINASKASNFLNLRNLMCTIKKQIYKAATACLFEQNSDILWVNFKNQIATVLDRIQSTYGIRLYKIIKTSSDSDIKLSCRIIIYPIYAVEAVEVGITLTDNEVTIE